MNHLGYQRHLLFFLAIMVMWVNLGGITKQVYLKEVDCGLSMFMAFLSLGRRSLYYFEDRLENNSFPTANFQQLILLSNLFTKSYIGLLIKINSQSMAKEHL